MYFWYDVYEKRSDGRIWCPRCKIYSSTKKEAEKEIRESHRKVILTVFRAKSEDPDSRIFKEFHKESKIHEGIPSIKELEELEIEIPPMQSVPYEYEEDPVDILEPEFEPKYKPIKCEFCAEEVPKNGAAQFSHLKKHIKQLVDRGILSESEAKKIRKVKLDPKMKKRFLKAFS